MFPEHEMDIGILSPLSWASVIHELLLPEVVVLLIQEDLHLSRTECTAIFRASSKPQAPAAPAAPPLPSPQLQQEIKQELIPIDPALLTPHKATYIDLTTPVKMEELPITFEGIDHGSNVIDLTLVDSDSD